MKKFLFIIALLTSILSYGQSQESVKVTIINDSIFQMSLTNGRSQLLIPAPVAGKSIIVQSIDVRNKVNDRIYSASTSMGKYLIGYKKGSYWYDLAELDFETLNAKGNTTVFTSATLVKNIWDESEIDAAPLMIRFNKPMNFSSGWNKLTLYITYRILN